MRHDGTDRPARTGDARGRPHNRRSRREVREKLFAAAPTFKMQKARLAENSANTASIYNNDDAFNGNGENRNTK
jgi:hypothetical protein